MRPLKFLFSYFERWRTTVYKSCFTFIRFSFNMSEEEFSFLLYKELSQHDLCRKYLEKPVGNVDCDLRIIDQNTRSYNENVDEFLVVLESLKIKFHCIFLTECWLNELKNPDQIDGYNMFRSYNSLNQNDEVVVYIDNSLSVSCNQLLLGGVATSLSLTFDWNRVICNLLATYRSPSSSLPLFIESINNGNIENLIETVSKLSPGI